MDPHPSLPPGPGSSGVTHPKFVLAVHEMGVDGEDGHHGVGVAVLRSQVHRVVRVQVPADPTHT